MTSSRWYLAAMRFDLDNPKVWSLFEKFTFQAIKAGRKHLGAKMIFERIRWYTAVETTDEVFKINNNYTAFYSRKFMQMYPHHKGFFRTREVQA